MWLFAVLLDFSLDFSKFLLVCEVQSTSDKKM